MAPAQALSLFSPAELSYLHTSLAHIPPIRSDSRQSTQFRPLAAETDILPAANGSARICFADGTEAIVGVKAEVEQTTWQTGGSPVDAESEPSRLGRATDGDVDKMGEGHETSKPEKTGAGHSDWVEMSIDVPGCRDDDPLPVFLSAMLREALLAAGELVDRLWINRRWHWKLHVDILLLSPPRSYPIPLLSSTTHLALLSTRLPALVSESDEDPLFNDDWEAAIPIYPRPTTSPTAPNTPVYASRPPVTLLVAVVGPNIIFDPAQPELAVADALLAVSLTTSPVSMSLSVSDAGHDPSRLRLLSIRTIDPPSRQTTPGIPDLLNPAIGGAATLREMRATRGHDDGVWRPPRGGMKPDLIAKVVDLCLRRGGVGEEVLAGLEGVDVG